MLSRSGHRKTHPSRAEKEQLLEKQLLLDADHKGDRKHLVGTRQSSFANRHGLQGMTEAAYELLDLEGVDTSGLPVDVAGDSGMYLLETENVDVLFAIESAGSYYIDRPNGDRVLAPWAERLEELIRSGSYHTFVAARFDRLLRDGTISANIFDLLRAHRVAVLTRDGLIKPWTEDGEASFKFQSLLADLEKQRIVNRTKNGQANGLAAGSWTLASPPPYGVRLREVVVGQQTRRLPEWDETGLEVIASVIKGIARGAGPRDMARKHLVGLPKRSGNGVIGQASRSTDKLIRQICTELRAFYEEGRYETIFTVNGRLTPRTLEMSRPSEVYDFMPTSSQFEAAYRRTLERGTNRTSVSSSLVVGLFTARADEASLSLRSSFHRSDSERCLVARDSNGAIRVSVLAEELEADLRRSLMPPLEAIVNCDRNSLESISRESNDDRNRLQSAIESLDGQLRRLLDEKLATDNSDSLAYLSKRQREIEEQLGELHRRLEAAEPQPEPSTSANAQSLLEALMANNEVLARQLVQATVHEAVITEDGSWSASLYWIADDGTIHRHPLSGRIQNRARGAVKAADPYDMWLDGKDAEEIHRALTASGRSLDLDTLVNHYLRPKVGGMLATCTNPVVLQVARGVITGSKDDEFARSPEWARRVREVYFDEQGVPMRPGPHGRWGTFHTEPPEWRHELVRVLDQAGGRIKLDDAARALNQAPPKLRSRIYQWHRKSDSVPIEVTEDAWVHFRPCPHCSAARPTQLPIPEPVGPVCTSCRRDIEGLEFDATFSSVLGVGYTL